MATSSNSRSSSSVRSARPSASAQYQAFIEKQLDRTRLRVKMVDLSTVLLGLVGATLAYLLVVVLIDHWVVGLGRGSRLLALVVLVGGVGYCLAAFLVPLLLKRINPAYAARAIEESDPSLKNSLINYLMFRGNASPVGRAVERVLRKQAALDLKHVSMDTAVDHGKLIHIGYAVGAIAALFVAYLIFSPKDVFQTVHRVVVPWADIERPSRVQITDVQPGDGNVLFGQTVAVSARVEHVRGEETVTLFFSTKDKQIVEQPIRMQHQQATTWTCTLPEDQKGLERDLVYRIEAGDARTREFALQVLPVPTILVDQIEYEYPDYTQLQDTTDRKGGDIHALEGTYVTIRARTNRPIQSAWIQFDPESSNASSGRSPVTQRMQAKGKEATYAFWLKMKPDSTQPQYATYQLRFKDDQEMHSQAPIIHQISVVRDLPPEVAILTPQDVDTEVPEDGRQRIEVRAVDPDFGLARLTLHAVSDNKSLLEYALFDEGQTRTGQVVRNFDFIPRQLGLPVGAEVVFWAVAEDNRTAPRTEKPNSNRERTRDYRITIVQPKSTAKNGTAANPPGQQDKATDNAQDGPPDVKKPNAKQPDTTGSQSPNRQENASDKPGDQQGDTQADQPGDKQGDTQGDQQGDKSGNQQGEKQGDQPGEQPGEKPGDKQDQAGGPSGQQSADQQQGSETGDSRDTPEGQQAGSERTEQNSGGAMGGQDDQAAGDQPAGQDAAAGASGQGAESSTQGTGQNGGDSQHPGGSDGSSSGRGQGMSTSDDHQAAGQPNGGRRAGDSRNPSASGEPLHDGEVFERAMDFFDQADRQQASRDQQGADGQASTADGSSESSEETAGAEGAEGQRSGAETDGSTGGRSDSPSSDSGMPADKQPATSDQMSTGEGASDGSQTQDTAGSTGGQDSQQRGGQTSSDDEKQPGGADKSTDQGSQGADTGKRTDDSAVDGSTGTGGQQEGPAQQPSGGMKTSSPDQGGASSPALESDPRQDGGEKGATGQPLGGTSQPGDAGSDGATPGSPETPTTGDASTGMPPSDQHSDKGSSAGGEKSSDTAGGTGSQPGSDSANPRTGGSASEATPGSSPGAGKSSDQPQASPSSSGQSDGSEDSSGQKAGKDDDQASGQGSATEAGEGGSGRYGSITGDKSQEIPDADAANLQYARKATDLVLRRLQDQQDKPDPELMKRLGWTADDLRAFVRRWQSLKRAAKEEKIGANDDMEDALKSLGLRPIKPVHLSDSKRDDQQRGLHDAGSRSRPPAEFLEQFNAYRKAAAREHRSGG